ncbi:hypothetical protein M569_00493 [Genlisea aurea]|uniref:Uncharacterized protein n=1 Tax=Genlisea aurea TaxID=192259 RepID=S8EE46_9LAMI|nr:hypothetical protein M569_00493 [Genlisea aurea]
MDEETRKLISYGFALAREVEFNLPDLMTRPDILSDSCDEIARVFSLCKRRLSSSSSSSSLPLDDVERKAMDVPDSTRGFSASSSKGGTTRNSDDRKYGSSA